MFDQTAQPVDRRDEVESQIYYRLIERLNASEDRYRSLVESLRDIVFQCDEQGRILFLNSVWKNILGFDPTSCMGEKLSDFVIPSHRECFQRTLMQKGGAAPPVGELYFESFSGQILVMDLSIRYVDGGTIGSLHDVTLRKEAEEALKTAKTVAEEASVMKSRFLANMSHEIRTPISAVLGFASLLNDPGEGSNRDEMVERIGENGEHLLRLIDDILDYSRIEAGHITLSRDPFDPRTLINGIVDDLETQALRKKLSLHSTFSKNFPDCILADATRLRQILSNLVVNAIKFTNSGSVSIEADYDHEVSSLRVSVIDSGIGMSEQDVERVFEPFCQADGSHTRKHGGTGLGLTIARKLADAMGGAMTVESSLGRGSRFTLLLPATHQTRLSSPTQPIPSDLLPKAFKGRVLLVEDYLDLQRLVKRYLDKWALDSDVASDGEAACLAVEEARRESRPYDLILIDMQMPRKDGYQATRDIRAHGFKGAIVSVTAHAMAGDREKCIEAGCDDYLAKPVSIEVLKRTLARFLPDDRSDLEPRP